MKQNSKADNKRGKSGTKPQTGLFKISNKQKKAVKKRASIPKTVQDTIPYECVYANGIIETSPGTFTKSYLLQDVNFKIATQQEQENIFLRYGDLLNMFGHEVKVEVSIFNRSVDQDKFCESVLIKYKHDELDTYRQEYNDILVSHMQEGRNNLMHEKYITISIEAENIEAAINTFTRLDAEVSAAIKRINGCETFPMTTAERLNILYDIYNIDAELPFYAKATIDGQEAETFNLEWVKKLGITTKDVIGPASIRFNKDYFTLGDKYGRVLFLDNLPTILSTDLICDLNDIACNMLTSIHFEPIRQDKSMKLIRNQMVNINSNVIDAQKRAAKSGYSPDLISPDLLKAQEEANRILTDMTSRNQKMYLVTVVVTLFADSTEELEKLTKSIQTIAAKYLCSMKKLNYQQEQGLTTALPLASNKIQIKRLLTTESASLFIPFAAQELSQPNGMYYGLNAVSRNLILFNRLNSKNANGVILGTPGSGKSFSAKREIINVLLSTDSDVYIIDPEREYAPLAELLGGEVIRIAAGSKNYINPLDMDIDYADDDDPITLKSDFIGSLCDTVIGGRFGLSPIQKSVIDRCVRRVYQGYMDYMHTVNSDKGKQEERLTIDRDKMPTLDDFYELLLNQPEPEAQNIALALELYCRGSLDTFAHRTNVDTSSRFIVYDIKDIGSGMKEMGLQVCLNDIWNKIIENKKKNKRTWFYIDEFYLLTQTDSSARFLQQVYKRARKWGGVPTGITQNVEDLLSSKEARGIINNCDFIMMLNQSPLDRAELSAMLDISPTQMSYITNSEVGQGLLYTGSKSIVPFIDKYPHDTRTFKAMTTKMEDIAPTEDENQSHD